MLKIYNLIGNCHPTTNCPEFPFNTKRNLLLIFKEAIINILKHADANLVTVESSSENGQFILKITDNGNGFDVSTLKKGGHGLVGRLALDVGEGVRDADDVGHDEFIMGPCQIAKPSQSCLGRATING